MSALRSFVSSRIFKLPKFAPGLRIGDFLTLYFFTYTPSGRALEFQLMVSSGIKKLELKFEKLFWTQDRLLSRSPFSMTGLSVLACTGIFPIIEKSIQGIEHSLVSCRRRRLWICKKRFPIYHAYPIYLAADFSRGLAILLVHEEEEITLVELEREIIVHCVQIRHFQKDFRPTFLSKILRVEIPTSNTRITKCSFSICQFFVK